jgi:hypothetical protein
MELVSPWRKNINMCEDTILKEIFRSKNDEMGCLGYYEAWDFFVYMVMSRSSVVSIMTGYRLDD